MREQVREQMGDLQGQVKFLNDALESTSQAFAAGYPDGRILLCNRAFCDLTGYSRKELLGGFTWSEGLTPPEWREREAAALGELNRTGRPLRYEKEYARKDGSRVPVELLVHRAVDDNGCLLYYYAFVTDITERRQAEAALTKYQLMFHAARDMLFMVTLEGAILDANDAAVKTYGYSRDELLKMNARDLRVSEQRAELAAQLERSFKGKFMYETIHRRKDGSSLPVEISSRGLTAGGQKVIVAIVRDITERKKAEEKLKGSEARFRTLFEDASDAIFIADVDTGLVIDCNPNAEKLLGRPRGEILGLHQTELHPPGEEEKYEKIFEQHAREGGGTLGIETEVIHRDGRRIPVIISARSTMFCGKRIMMGYFLDITERKRAEEKLKDAKAQAELYLDLMGHDINNMNQISMGFLELAHNIVEMDGKLGEDNIVLLDKAIESLRNSSQLIDNVRKLQRERMGLYKCELLDAGAVAEDAIGQFRHIPGRAIEIAYVPEGHCRVRANVLLKDVLINLIGNAVKHSRGNLRINVRVEPATDDGKAYCRIAVEDDGPGIPDALKSTLFDRLSLTATRARGKGFGLCLIKLLVDDYRGKFLVEDRVKGDHTKGARFVVMLPAVEK